MLGVWVLRYGELDVLIFGAFVSQRRPQRRRIRKMPLLPLIALVNLVPPEPPRELYNYLKAPDGSFSERVTETKGSQKTIEMVSQTWQGIPWKHQILVQKPAKPVANDTAILYITGDGPFKGDLTTLQAAVVLSGLPTAMLFDIPNQPLWEHREDDLIAHTFEKYLETGDASWPLLFPMAKAAIRAMDAVQREYPSIKRFVVTGASKRGWTTWMVGASKDKRVIGIAPMVYDNLNLPAQMRHQMESWGAYSPMIQDYTKRGLQGQIGSERGAKLATIVDPYSYRRNIVVPTLIVNGSNDEYWTSDALQQYWGGLAQPKWVVEVPNAGHDLNGGLEAAQSICGFARTLVGEGKMPVKLAWHLATSAKTATAEMISSGSNLQSVTIWTAPSTDRHFSGAKWSPVAKMDLGGVDAAHPKIVINLPDTKFVGAFAEFTYHTGDRTFKLTTPVSILKR